MLTYRARVLVADSSVTCIDFSMSVCDCAKNIYIWKSFQQKRRAATTISSERDKIWIEVSVTVCL